MKLINQMKSNKVLRSNVITLGIVVAAYALIKILIAAGLVSSLIKGLLVPLCIYSILAVSLNLTVGILGELSLGHAGFMCIGAFSSAFFSKCMEEAIPIAGIRFTIALVIGAAVTAVFGMLIGIPVLRLKGDYLAIVTLAFGEIIKNLVNILYIGYDENGFHFSTKSSIELGLSENGKIIIQGAQGITGTPNDSNFEIGIVLLILTIVIVLNLIHSRDGRAIMAIRDNTIAAESVGIHITKYKLMAFTISAALAGVAGVLYAHNISTLTALPKNFGYNMSIMILVFVVLGGIGSIRGSMIAAVILTMLPELLRGLNDYRMLIYAIVLIAMMLFNWAPACIRWREKMSYMFKKFISQEKNKVAVFANANTLQIVALVLGIISILVCCFFTLGGLAFGIAGLLCSIMGNNKEPKTGIGTAALICSIIGIAVSVINMIFGIFLATSIFLPYADLVNWRLNG